MSLRLRLVVAVALVALIALVAADVATYSPLQELLLHPLPPLRIQPRMVRRAREMRLQFLRQMRGLFPRGRIDNSRPALRVL